MPSWFVCKKALILGAFLFLLLPVTVSAIEQDCKADRIDEYAVVKKIYDGDTLRLSDNRKVRFIGVNTPELAHDEKLAEPLAEAAKRKLQNLISAGSHVGLRYDIQRKDRHRRTLAHVFRKDGLNVTAELIKRGYGFAIVVPPNNWQMDCYFQVEQEARNNKRGVWSHSYFKPRNTNELSDDMRGFMLVKGIVTRIGKGKKKIWLDMGKRFSIKLHRNNMHYFEFIPIDTIQGKQITIRGWVRYYNKKLRISLRHPRMLEIME